MKVRHLPDPTRRSDEIALLDTMVRIAADLESVVRLAVAIVVVLVVIAAELAYRIVQSL